MEQVKSMVRRIDSKRDRNEKGGVFRVLVSAHLGDGPKDCDCQACYDSGGKNHVYRARRVDDPEDFTEDLIVSPKQDLVGRFGAEKFRRLHPHEIPPNFEHSSEE